MEKLWFMAQTYVFFNWKYGGCHISPAGVETNIAGGMQFMQQVKILWFDMI